jgi:2-amino-4-hydroxy-6-hydroxymethyldihydropteridine diphosphokinase
MADVYLGLGSNVGDKERNIRKAIELIDQECTVLKKSKLYKTDPVGYMEQDWFLNRVIEVETSRKPKELLRFLKSIEKKLGRQKTVKNGPRTIDIDILLYDDILLDSESLTIPHPRLHKRLFVLGPLSDMCPDCIHPKLKMTVSEIRKNLKSKDKVEVYRH